MGEQWAHLPVRRIYPQYPLSTWILGRIDLRINLAASTPYATLSGNVKVRGSSAGGGSQLYLDQVGVRALSLWDVYNSGRMSGSARGVVQSRWIPRACKLRYTVSGKEEGDWVRDDSLMLSSCIWRMVYSCWDMEKLIFPEYSG